LRSHNDVAQRQMRTKEYTWAGVNDMQTLFRKIKREFEQRGKTSDHQSPRSSKL
jgi:hypothetical protein